MRELCPQAVNNSLQGKSCEKKSGFPICGWDPSLYFYGATVTQTLPVFFCISRVSPMSLHKTSNSRWGLQIGTFLSFSIGHFALLLIRGNDEWSSLWPKWASFSFQNKHLQKKKKKRKGFPRAAKSHIKYNFLKKKNPHKDKIVMKKHNKACYFAGILHGEPKLLRGVIKGYRCNRKAWPSCFPASRVIIGIPVTRVWARGRETAPLKRWKARVQNRLCKPHTFWTRS